MVFELSGWGLIYWLYVLVLPIALIASLISYIGMSSGKSQNTVTWLTFVATSLLVHGYFMRVLWAYKASYLVLYLAVVVFVDVATYVKFVRKKTNI